MFKQMIGLRQFHNSFFGQDSADYDLDENDNEVEKLAIFVPTRRK